MFKKFFNWLGLSGPQDIIISHKQPAYGIIKTDELGRPKGVVEITFFAQGGER